LLSFVAPGGVFGQAVSKLARIGILESDPTSKALESFRQGLHERGYFEGRNVEFEARWTHGVVATIPKLAEELSRLRVDVIFAPTTPAALAAKEATRSIPIVFAVAADPVGSKLVATLAKPGGNVTGLTTLNIDVIPKRLEILNELAGGQARNWAVLFDPGDASNQLLLKTSRGARASARVGHSTVPRSEPERLRRRIFGHGGGAHGCGDRERRDANDRSCEALGRLGCQVTHSRHLRIAGIRRGWRTGVLFGRLCRQLSTRGRLRREDPEGRKARRSSCRTGAETGVRAESEDRERARPNGSALVAPTGYSGHRLTKRSRPAPRPSAADRFETTRVGTASWLGATQRLVRDGLVLAAFGPSPYVIPACSTGEAVMRIRAPRLRDCRRFHR